MTRQPPRAALDVAPLHHRPAAHSPSGRAAPFPPPARPDAARRTGTARDAGSRDAPAARSAARQDGFSLLELLVTMAVISILTAIAMRVIPHAVDLSRLSATVASLRVVSDAIIQLEKENELPNGFFKVADLEGVLGGYVPRLPTVDGWGNDLYYGKHAREEDRYSRFRVYSYGKDGIPDGGIVLGRWVDFDSDVVIESGEFLQTKW